MKKLITFLSSFIVTSSVASLSVACNKTENKTSNNTKTDEGKGLDLSSLTADSFKVLQEYEFSESDSKPLLKETKIDEINDKKIKFAVKEHLRVMLLQKVFDIKDFNPTPEKDLIWYMLSDLLLDTQTTTPILKLNVNSNIPTLKCEIKIEKTNWNDIKDNVQDFITEISTGHGYQVIKKQLTVEELKSYYDLIKGEEVKINITKQMSDLKNCCFLKQQFFIIK